MGDVEHEHNSEEVDTPAPEKDQSSNTGQEPEPVVRHSQRNKPLSLKAKENKVISLSADLTVTMNEQFEVNDNLLTKVRESECVDEIKSFLKELERGFEYTSEIYKELEYLCENKVVKETKDMYSFFCNEVESTRQTMVKALEHLLAEEEEEKELQEAIERTRRKLDEQMVLFNERMKKRKSQEHVSMTQSKFQSSEHIEILTSTPQRSRVQVESRAIDRESITRSEKETSTTTKSSDSSLEAIQQLAQSLVTTMKASKRTAIEPTMFKGEVLEFAEWEADFDAFVESEGLTGKEPLRYLKKFVEGEAKKCINGHFITNTIVAYEEARKQLKERFGNKMNIARTFRKKLADWPKIHPKDGAGLVAFGDLLTHIRSGMQTITELRILNDCQENEKMSEKLPEWMKSRWARSVVRKQRLDCKYPSFSEFTDFVIEEAEFMSQPIMQQKANQPFTSRNQGQPNKERSLRNLHSNTSITEKCLYCSMQNHSTTQCGRLEAKTYQERTNFVKENNLCFSCLTKGHRSMDCTKKATCNRCSKRHPTSLHQNRENSNGRRQHFDSQPEDKGKREERIRRFQDQRHNSQGQEKSNREDYQDHAATGAGNSNGKEQAKNLNSNQDNPGSRNVKVNMTKSSSTGLLSMVVPVYVSSPNCTDQQLVYALLDTQSDACFISQDVAAVIQPFSEKEQITVTTLNGEKTIGVRKFFNITVTGYNSGKSTTITAYEQETIPCERKHIPVKSHGYQLRHLQPIADMLPPALDIPIGLLIGVDCPEALAPLESIVGKPGEPFAIRTILGWTLCGGNDNTLAKRRVHKIDICTANSAMAKELESTDYNLEENRETMLSQDDLKFLRIMESKTRQKDNGYYEMPLPFRSRPILPNNKEQAVKRLKLLEKKFAREESFKVEYTSFMSELIENGQAEKVPEGELDKTGDVWYIPHFAVRHSKKNKIRVVFDCSAKYRDTAINEHLLQGPDQINNLIGILCRFRKENIAICCDIEKMFYNFYVRAEDRDFLRFLWYEKDGCIQEYRMTVHLFGATSSPGVATYGLRRIAQEHSNISPRAAAFIHRDFYVDDGITSVETKEEAIKLIKGAIQLCNQGKTRLHKFVCNDEEVLETIPLSERSIQQPKDPLQNILPTQRTLGLEWSIGTDTFTFTSAANIKPQTKRGVLSTVAQIYDPLGFVAPFTLKGKQILQEICRQRKGWDDDLDTETVRKWREWVDQLALLSEVQINRCIKPKDFGQSTRTEVHYFSDASSQGYGACAYVRMTNSEGKVHCSLLLAKARVAPLKVTTIPRLELQGAVVATRLKGILQRELQMKIDGEYFWTDSKIVLGYIANETKRFHVYVTNRIQEIKDVTETKQWHYIQTTQNPADMASRGANLKDIKQSTWLRAPEFLWKTNIEAELKGGEDLEAVVEETDPEVRRVKVNTTVVDSANTLNLGDRLKKFSDWKKLVRAIGNLKQMAQKKTWAIADLSRDQVKEAETIIVKVVQREQFTNEIDTIMNAKPPIAGSSIRMLDPFLDDCDVLRVGGRAKLSLSLTYEEKHPIIIPKSSHIALLLARYYHKKIYHQGRIFTLGAIRDAGYWLVGASKLVNSMVRKCFPCNKLRGKLVIQRMGLLPRERLDATPPFTNVGMDCFGHFTVKERRSNVKRWAVVFTCMYSRAVHIELLDDMSADAFINALRCLIAIRGPVRTLFSDRGTNFVGARNEFRKEVDMAKDLKLKEYFTTNEIEFKMNPPSASHQGGVWERQIRTIRSVLNGMFEKYQSRVDTATLRTMFYEVMNIVNSRPLAVDSINSPHETVITPNHILTMKSQQSVPPPGRFDTEDIYGQKRWRKTQQFAEEFWQLWKLQYLKNITVRQKWETKKPNVELGDVVTIHEDGRPRNEWRTGIVESVQPGEDGLVRKATVRLANRHLDKKGQVMTEAQVLERPIHKLVIVTKNQNQQI